MRQNLLDFNIHHNAKLSSQQKAEQLMQHIEKCAKEIDMSINSQCNFRKELEVAYYETELYRSRMAEKEILK